MFAFSFTVLKYFKYERQYFCQPFPQPFPHSSIGQGNISCLNHPKMQTPTTNNHFKQQSSYKVYGNWWQLVVVMFKYKSCLLLLKHAVFLNKARIHSNYQVLELQWLQKESKVMRPHINGVLYLWSAVTYHIYHHESDMTKKKERRNCRFCSSPLK